MSKPSKNTALKFETGLPIFMYFNTGSFENLPSTPMTGLPTGIEDCPEANEYLQALCKLYKLKPLITTEKEGRAIHDIIPIQGKENDYSNEGSDYFPFHVEVPQYSITERPKYVALYCLRGLAQANTLLIPAVALVKKLHELYGETFIWEMYKPHFIAQYGVSFGDRSTFTTPILHNVEEDGEIKTYITLDLAEMVGANATGADILSRIKHAIQLFFDELTYKVNLKEGDLLLFNNLECIHARSSFKQHLTFDGSHRWLKRMYLMDK